MSLPRLLTPASGVPVLSCMGILSSIGSSHELSVLEQGAEEDASEFAKKKFSDLPCVFQMSGCEFLARLSSPPWVSGKRKQRRFTGNVG